ncbi:hypothetical protein C1645_816449 [Glomus cerebriforme]|uniref:Uncharacterized protein n=1 Tax=Glomus cerebriforme TaxID=658196 RepID=A0A397TGR0_9GLOM|nr:hypothetical protein C1645_816449 [Glomus cerebriforme]
MNDNNNIFPAHLSTSPDYNYQQPISDDFLNINVTNFSDHNHQSSNDSGEMSPDNNYQQYDTLNNISLYSSQQYMSNDASNDNDAISPDHNHQQYDASNNISFYDSQQSMSNDASNDNVIIFPHQQYDTPNNISFYDSQQSMSNDASNDDVTIFPNHYHQQYDTPNNISLYNSQQSMSYGTSNDSAAIFADQQCNLALNGNVALNDNVTISSYNDASIQMQYGDQASPSLNSLNITINSPQNLSEIFRFGFKIVIMPITNSNMQTLP